MPKKPIIIGVTGGSGGGKTSVSRAILSNFPDEKIAMIEHDSYYKDQSHLTFEERVSTNYDHPFAFDTDLMIEHINELIAGRPVDIPIYDYTQHTRSNKTYRQEPQDVFIFVVELFSLSLLLIGVNGTQVVCYLFLTMLAPGSLSLLSVHFFIGLCLKGTFCYFFFKLYTNI